MRQRMAVCVLVSSALAASAATPAADGRPRRDRDRGRFFLGGTARLARDPENRANSVIRIRTDVEPFFGTVSRRANVKVRRLDNMLEFKAWFLAPSKSCTGGAPRLQLAIDADGDGRPDGNAFGYFGPSPNFRGCPPGTWLYEDLTGAGDAAITAPLLFPSTGGVTPNEELEWDLTQLGGTFYNTWSQLETFFDAFPHHLVCSVALVDDTFGIPFMSGTAYYDLFSAGRATWKDGDDTFRRGFARGCRDRDHDDDIHPGDVDRDHDQDEGDAGFDSRRRLQLAKPDAQD